MGPLHLLLVLIILLHAVTLSTGPAQLNRLNQILVLYMHAVDGVSAATWYGVNPLAVY